MCDAQCHFLLCFCVSDAQDILHILFVHLQQFLAINLLNLQYLHIIIETLLVSPLHNLIVLPFANHLPCTPQGEKMVLSAKQLHDLLSD